MSDISFRGCGIRLADQTIQGATSRRYDTAEPWIEKRVGDSGSQGYNGTEADEGKYKQHWRDPVYASTGTSSIMY